MADAVIVSTARTPIGKAVRGAFNLTHGAEMGGHVIAQAAATTIRTSLLTFGSSPHL